MVEILREHRRSGLPLLAFARKHGLCYASLMRRRSRQRKGAKVLVLPDTEADPRFVPVKIESEVLSGDYVLSWTVKGSEMTIKGSEMTNGAFVLILSI